MAQYGLLANLASVPLMGTVVVPASVLAAVLAPFGAEGIGLWIMGLGLQWVLWVADWVSGLGGAQRFVAGPHVVVLPLMALGALFVILWQGRSRYAGMLAILMALGLWQADTRPDVLVSDTGVLVGVRTAEGRALRRGKGAGVVARNWLENDGDGSSQKWAAGRWRQGGIVHLSGKRALAKMQDCREGQIIVASVPADALKAQGCRVFDPVTLRETGALALSADKDGWQVVSARDRAGVRPWTHWPKDAR